MRLWWLGLLGGLSGGCDPDCGDVSRINGSYIVNSHVSVPVDQLVGENLESYPYAGVFFNGTSEWDLSYTPSQQTFQILIDNQPFEASYTEDPSNCNAFTLGMSGIFTTPGGSTHSFEWEGQMLYLGVKLRGTFRYLDTWQNTAGESGSITVPQGELLANPRDGADTGASGA